MCGPSCPQTRNSASASLVLGLKVFAINLAIFLFVRLFVETGSQFIHKLGCPGSHYLNQAGLEFTKICFLLLGLKVYTTWLRVNNNNKGLGVLVLKGCNHLERSEASTTVLLVLSFV